MNFMLNITRHVMPDNDRKKLPQLRNKISDFYIFFSSYKTGRIFHRLLKIKITKIAKLTTCYSQNQRFVFHRLALYWSNL
ncbi:hypothetical protein BpHYR1_044813 [Brachionus plicatilis]|uniref:Uncharacterized protein n=1 Tax=Brachionus plicatilis TaxID=10195 RepID=A0A3M7QGU0_BRAPC|nr:hypothetical protein BpHYR1_044813 [Brachionus plicatilis]